MVFILSALLSGCAQFESHHHLMSSVIAVRDTENAQAAVTYFNDRISPAKQKRLIYQLELGELLRDDQQYEASTQIWLQAEGQIQDWERNAQLNPENLLSYLGASTISERLAPYAGQDYEKVWLSTRIALNHIALNDWEKARADIQRTHEREQIITNFRAAEIAQVREKAQQRGWDINTQTLDGYPVEYINSPEVLELENSYQNAFSHYLAGFIYEAFNEPGLAAPGYRKAIELNPDTPVLEEGLEGMEARLRNSSQTSQTDVLFIIESGDAPARISHEIRLALPVSDKLIYVQLALPVIYPTQPAKTIKLQVGETLLEAQPIVDLNAMARRALHDEMPALLLRASSRALTKSAMQAYALQGNSRDTSNAEQIFKLFVLVGAVLPEYADERIWRTLPGNIAVARSYLEPGSYPLIIDSINTGHSIEIDGRHAIVPIRITGNQFLVGPTATYGKLSKTAGLAPSANTQDNRQDNTQKTQGEEK